MNVRDLLQGLTAEPIAPVPVSGVACHSKQVRPGDLFIAIEGATTDGHAFIDEAIARGAAAVIAQRLPALTRTGTEASTAARPCPCILVAVVESGTGQLANVAGLTVAGKTGTAQKLEPTGRYSHSRFVASFVGFGPVPDSRFVIVVSVDEPRPLYFGGVVAAPLFKRLVERLTGYWELESAHELTGSAARRHG